MKKVYINEKNIATIVCPKCEKTKSVDVTEYKDIDKAIRVKFKCACGYSDTILLERRKFYRKETKLHGVYTCEEERGLMTVTNISRSGLKIRLNVKRDLKVGDKLFVEFHLDDKERSLIKKKGVIKYTKGPYIGIEFTSIEQFDKIGAYLIK